MNRKMRIIGVAMIKNEEDIIECFVRYHVNFLDEMIILDNGSSDGTSRILASLKHEGLPVHLKYDPQIAYRQAQITTALVHNAVKMFDADFVVVLDADEFLRARKDNMDVRLVLENSLRGVDLAFVQWSTYVPDSSTDFDKLYGPKAHALHSIQRRRKSEATPVYKVIVSRKWCERPGFELRQGNHDVVPDNDGPIPVRIKIMDLVLAHFPIRSKEQAERKYLLGWLANLALKRPALFDWALYYQRFKYKEIEGDDIRRLAYFYNCTERSGNMELVQDPVPVPSSVVSLYSDKQAPSTLSILLSHCERLAQSVGGTELSSSLDWSFDVSSTLFTCTLGPAVLSIGEAAALYCWLSPANSEEKLFVAESRYGGDLSHALKAIAAAKHFNMQLVRLDEADTLGFHAGVDCVDRLILHGASSPTLLMDDYNKGLAALRLGGGLLLFDVLDTRDQAVRNLADTHVAHCSLWKDEQLYGRFLFAVRTTQQRVIENQY